VVIPAHNEQRLLPGCLAALRYAADSLGKPVHILVVADACADQTVDAARAGQAQVIRIRARNVGMARAAGMQELLRRMAGTDPAAVWLATTDADSLVPGDWLRRQLANANQGWDVVLGTVTVADWEDHPAHVTAAYQALYEFGDEPHPHVHGANFGLRASAYLAVGGFRPLRTAEDHALLAAVTDAGYAVLRTREISVRTSARRRARAPGGFSQLLQTLAYIPAAAPAGSARTQDATSLKTDIKDATLLRRGSGCHPCLPEVPVWTTRSSAWPRRKSSWRRLVQRQCRSQSPASSSSRATAMGSPSTGPKRRSARW
jgi:hypothetical protein